MPAWTRELIELERDAQGDLPPPWARFPGYTRTTLGWRMGHGEEYRWAHEHWFKAQGWDREGRIAYFRRHPPAPYTWADALGQHLDGEDALEAEALAELGLVAEDVAAGTWALRHAPAFRPWSSRDEPVTYAWLHARELAFFCRWAAGLRAEGSLQAWLDEQPPPPAWQAFGRALLGDLAVAKAAPMEQGWRRVMLECGARGAAPPPWSPGVPAPNRDRVHGREVGYADAWMRLQEASVDDVATWRALRPTWPEAPPAWRRQLRRWAPWEREAWAG
ncbi:MAG: hypothetical protein H6741_23370 [Alphaproteobacteria bacterium]|nr:hypothetical protein [Alphaproteobacteria bacterium]MCB9795649.1 hypothetical protein [Alphaproteobacteria bacterium]